jgi:hypothetical protein
VAVEKNGQQLSSFVRGRARVRNPCWHDNAPSGGARQSRPIKPIMMALPIRTRAAAPNAYIGKAQWLLIALKETPGASSTCMATSGIGSRIAGTTATRGTLETARHERLEIAIGASSAAVPGSSVLKFSGPQRLLRRPAQRPRPGSRCRVFLLFTECRKEKNADAAADRHCSQRRNLPTSRRRQTPGGDRQNV